MTLYSGPLGCPVLPAVVRSPGEKWNPFCELSAESTVGFPTPLTNGRADISDSSAHTSFFNRVVSGYGVLLRQARVLWITL